MQVNRFWQSLFGSGIVGTADNFGSQGESPSHPELLDWLAGEFIGGGWDVKKMMRLLVTSATYRQSSRLTPTLLERDPENRLLARSPRFRLQAEFVRDQALAASGLLIEKLAGLPSNRIIRPAFTSRSATTPRRFMRRAKAMTFIGAAFTPIGSAQSRVPR